MATREKITLNWRPAAAEAAAAVTDEFVECRNESAQVPTASAARQVTTGMHRAIARQDIRARLKNWARWARWSSGHGGADCMTGLICDRLRKAALGDVWSGTPVPPDIDEPDAELIESAWRKLPPKQKKLLRWTYVFNWQTNFICKRLGIKPHPYSVFQIELARAEKEIEKVL